MPNHFESRPGDRFRFQRAAVRFLDSNSYSVEHAALTLGVGAGDLLAWRKKYSPVKADKSLGGMARLRTENEALRMQLLTLQVQWDILETTLRALSTMA